MSQPMNKTPSQIFEAFGAEFMSAYVNSRRTMTGLGLAVFANRIVIVPNDTVLSGGPYFVRIKFGSLMTAACVWSAMGVGGRSCVLQMVQILQSGNTSKKQAKLLFGATLRLRTIFDEVQSIYWHTQTAKPSDHIH